MIVSEIIKATGGTLVSGNINARIDPASISTDSRTIKKGSFFLPLKGENFNGELFIDEALKKGAIGSLTARRNIKASMYKGKIIIFVKDTVKALQDIAHYHRMRFDIPVIGVTGSNGKTTTKDMISHVLSKRFNVLKNEGTKNNQIGVPQTLLKLNKKHDICVLEMGANHKGEIRLLSGIARPTIAIIINIGPSHLKFLKDLKGVFAAKKEILEFLGKNSLVIINGDDEYLAGIKGKGLKVIRFGFNDRNGLRASLLSASVNHTEFLLDDKARFELNLLGTHNVYNALAAIAVGRHFNLSIKSIADSLAGYRPAHMRLNVKNIGGFIIIDDTYNSNPLSMKSALQAMRVLPSRGKWIVSADMLELGNKEDDFHRMIGESVAKAGFKGLLTFGALSRSTYDSALRCGMNKDNAWYCSTRREVADILYRVAKRGDAILVKGSRAMKMEEVIEMLKKRLTLTKGPE